MAERPENRQFHVRLDEATLGRIDWLADVLEASSAAEIVRRALQEFEFRGGETERLPPGSRCRMGFYRIGAGTKERLDRLAGRHGANYREVLTAAVVAFVAPVEATLALRAAGNPDRVPPVF